MGVAHGLFQCDVCRVDDGIAVVERGVVVSVGAECKAYLLLPLGVAVEVGEEVILHLQLLGDVYVPCLRLAGRALAHLGCELHVLLTFGRLLQQLTFWAQVCRLARCPCDGAPLVSHGGQVEVGHQVVEMSLDVDGSDVGCYAGIVVHRCRYGHCECFLFADATLAECCGERHCGVAAAVCRAVYHACSAYHTLI